VHHYQCLVIPVELPVMDFVFHFLVLGIAEMLVWLAYDYVKECVSFIM
jgi:hypothetical protein